MSEVVQLVNELVKNNVRVIIIHEGIDNQGQGELAGYQKLLLGIFSSLAEMERDLISLRTKEGLKVAKDKGNIGGRRIGFTYSKYDKHETRIREMLAKDHTLSAIIKELGYGRTLSLSEYLARKG